jgi:hypothetical protein
MRQFLIIILFQLFFILTGYNQTNQDNFLLKIINTEIDEVGVESGYVNINGDTIIPIGKYYYCYSDTLKYFAIVLDKGKKCIAIDKEENILFEVFWYDNGPDYFSEGLFRIIKNGKIGFADRNGQIIIEPIYECATPFENGKSKVAFDCYLKEFGEYKRMESNEWFFIDNKGKILK